MAVFRDPVRRTAVTRRVEPAWSRQLEPKGLEQDGLSVLRNVDDRPVVWPVSSVMREPAVQVVCRGCWTLGGCDANGATVLSSETCLFHYE